MKAHHRNEDEEREIRKRFADKNDSLKILIVTEKLLTGFDAPILYCMYLDKPMRDHVLLQAIARVNRPYEDDDGLVKPYGFVLDFVGIFENLEKALAFDSDVVGSVIKNLDVLKALFAARFEEIAPSYLTYAHSWDDRGKERAIAHFGDKETARDHSSSFLGGYRTSTTSFPPTPSLASIFEGLSSARVTLCFNPQCLRGQPLR